MNGQFRKGAHWRERKPLYSKRWCVAEYLTKGRSAADIAKEFGVGDTAVHFWLKKHGIKTRSVSEARRLKHWGASGRANPMWNKRGALNPHWLGGVTPERQLFYESRAWKRACSAVWKRDRATCRRCERKRPPLHVHHVISFSDRKHRASVANLVLLCVPCHRFVHSRRNVAREHLPRKRGAAAPARLLSAR